MIHSFDRTYLIPGDPGLTVRTDSHMAVVSPGRLVEDARTPTSRMLEMVPAWVATATIPLDGHALAAFCAGPTTCDACNGRRVWTCKSCGGAGSHPRQCDQCDESHDCVCDECDKGKQFCACTDIRPVRILGEFSFDAWRVLDLLEELGGADRIGRTGEVLVLGKGDRVGVLIRVSVDSGAADPPIPVWS